MMTVYLAFSSYGMSKVFVVQLRSYEVIESENEETKKTIYATTPVVRYGEMVSYHDIIVAGNEQTAQEEKYVLQEEPESRSEDPPIIEIPDIQSGESILFDSLKTVNEDVCAWIRIQGTAVDHPVVQSGDNSEYLNQFWNGTENRNGSIFIDCENSGFEQNNTIMYGHNMVDGTMFADISKYKDSEFFRRHPVIQIYTPTEILEAKVFAAYTTTPTSEAFSKVWTQEYLDLIQSRTVLETDIEITLGTRIVTLVTCDYGTFENARTVVHAKIESEGTS